MYLGLPWADPEGAGSDPLKITKIKGFLAILARIVYCFKSIICCILSLYKCNKCGNVNNCWHFIIYEQDKFRAQLS